MAESFVLPGYAPPRITPLGRALADARKYRRMTVWQLAQEIGISASALRRLENGTSHETRRDTIRACEQWAERRGITLGVVHEGTPDAA